MSCVQPYIRCAASTDKARHHDTVWPCLHDAATAPNTVDEVLQVDHRSQMRQGQAPAKVNAFNAPHEPHGGLPIVLERFVAAVLVHRIHNSGVSEDLPHHFLHDRAGSVHTPRESIVGCSYDVRRIQGEVAQRMASLRLKCFSEEMVPHGVDNNLRSTAFHHL